MNANHTELASELTQWLAMNEDIAKEVITWRYDTLQACVEVHIRSDYFLSTLVARYPIKITEKIGVLGNKHLFVRSGNLIFTTVIQASKIDAAV